MGAWPTEGYEHEDSKSVRGDKFVGCAFDEDNQPDLSEERAKAAARANRFAQEAARGPPPLPVRNFAQPGLALPGGKLVKSDKKEALDKKVLVDVALFAAATQAPLPSVSAKKWSSKRQFPSIAES